MNINDFPEELLINIGYFLLPDNSCNINEFKNYFLVNKKWNRIFNSNEMLNKLAKNNRLNKQYDTEIFTYYSLINRLCFEKIPTFSQDQDSDFAIFGAYVGALTNVSYSAKDRLR